MAGEVYSEIKEFRNGGMDSDSAYEDISPEDFVAATNFMTTGPKGSQMGYGTNVPGNVLLTGSLLPGINNVIGGGKFDDTSQIVGFRYNTGGNCQIILYDANAGTYRVIFTDKTDSAGLTLLPLNPQNEVRAILVNDTYLVWWAKGLEVGYTNLKTLASGGYGTVLDEDLSLLKPPCLSPPTGVYGDDAGQPANFLYGNLPQFIVQYVNADYNYCAWSTWSKRIVPYQQNTPTLGADVGKNNYIIVSVNIGSIRASVINIGCRFALNNFFTCKSVDRSYVIALPHVAVDISTQVYEAYNPATNIYSFVFYNNEVQLPIDPTETDLLYDYIYPSNAGALINGNIVALGDWETLYARPNISATVAAVGYDPNIAIPSGSTTGRLVARVINPGQSGSGAGNHKRIIVIELTGNPQTGDAITLITADIRNSSNIENYSRVVSSAENGNLNLLVTDIAAQIPGAALGISGSGYSITWIDNSYFTLQTFSVALHFTGATVANSIPTILDNCPYQVVLAWYDAKGGRPFPIQVIGQIATPSYAQILGQAVKLVVNINTIPAPVGAASYQILLTKPPVNKLIDVLGSFLSFKGTWNAYANSPTLTVNSGNIGDTYQITVPDSPAHSTYTNLGNNQTYDTGEYLVNIGGSTGSTAAGQYYRTLPSTFGNIAGGDILCLSLNPLALYNANFTQDNVTTVLSYDFAPGDRCTFHYWIDGSGVVQYFNNPCVDVSVLGYDAASYIVKLEKSTAFTIGGGHITYNGQQIDAKNIFFRLYSPAQLTQSSSNTQQSTLYYEVGSQYPVVNGNHSVTNIEVTNGGAYYKTRQYDDAIQPFAQPPHEVLANDLNYSDFYTSDYYSFGRARAYNDVLDQTEQMASIIPSQNYILGSKRNGLTRFYPANIYGDGNGQTSSSQGAIQIMWQRGDVLCVIQGRNTFYIPVNYAWTVLNDQLTGQSISEKLLNNGRYSDDGIGIGTSKESFCIRYGTAWFIDPYKGLPMIMEVNGIQPIAGKMSQFFKNIIPAAYAQGLKMHQYYDEFFEQVVLCIQAPSGVLTYFPFDAEWNPNDSYVIVPSDVTATPNGAHSTAAYNSTTGVVTYTPTTDYIGNDSATFTFNGGAGSVTKNNCLQWIAGNGVVSPFTFAPLVGQPLSTLEYSNTIGVFGINVPVSISITGGQYSINGGAWTSSTGNVNLYDSVQVRQTSSATGNTTTNAVLSIGSTPTTGTFAVTTGTTAVNPFSFTAQTNVPVSSVRTSNMITVSGNTLPAAISISGGGTYSVNGGSYISAGGFVNNGDTVQVRQTSSATPNTLTTVTLTIDIQTGAFNVTTVQYGNVAIVNQPYQRNNCPAGQSGTTVPISIAANTYFDTTQAGADAQAQAAAQTMANSTGTCLVDSTESTLLIDYLTDTTADLCAYVKTVGLTETGVIVTGTAESPSGPLQLPNDGRDPATCWILSSDKLGSGSPAWRFGINIAYFIQKYTGTLTTIDFEIRGRNTAGGAVGGSYALRDISEGVLELVGSVGSKIPAVTFGSSSPTSYSTNIVSGANGTVGIAVGSPILTLTYNLTTNALTVVTY